MSRAKVYCEVTCNNCGILAGESTYYKNASTISKLKEATKDWIWDEERAMNLCPECQEELNKHAETDEGASAVADAWEATKP